MCVCVCVLDCDLVLSQKLTVVSFVNKVLMFVPQSGKLQHQVGVEPERQLAAVQECGASTQRTLQESKCKYHITRGEAI